MTTVASECTPIHDLKFDQKSLDQLKRMRYMENNPKFINGLLGTNIFASIFAGKGPAGHTTGLRHLWTITQTDWDGYRNAMKGATVTFRRRIHDEAKALSIGYFMDGNYKLNIFWRNIANGCSF